MTQGITIAAGVAALISACSRFSARGWMLGTSGNLSVRIADRETPAAAFLITASGVDKAAVGAEQLLLLDQRGEPLRAAAGDAALRPSAETSIHLAAYQQLQEITAVYHVHSPHATWLSMRPKASDKRPIFGFGRSGSDYLRDRTPEDVYEPLHVHTFPGGPDGWEMIKGYDLWNEEDEARLPVFINHPAVPRIAADFAAYLQREQPRTPAMLIAGHGLTAWGTSPAAALRHVEVTEFLAQQSWLLSAK